ncbi:hypothetical protein [Glycomyces buryatensis]|uniref:Toxin-antitoxin system YwqK family antitoxin n=1 Tax=Glycomyces buryatensis TaxID=2570927 RepID=A0A4S8QMG0_9ACTN|nr:hypothetical protein [Glycomyces buryatensis]THV41914.1 hypothetical protein FAB82_09355 [Glycomyces buryatensis]
MGQEELMDTSKLIRVPDDELDMDGSQHFWYEGQRFTGIGFEENPDGGRDEISYHDGYQHGPARTMSAEGTVLEEDWYCNSIRNGISRIFRADGSISRATAYDGGTIVWGVVFDEDGETVTKTTVVDLDESKRGRIDKDREIYALPRIPPPSDAPHLNRHTA